MNMPDKLSSEEILKSLQTPDNTGRRKILKWVIWATVAVAVLIVLRLCTGDSGPATYRFFTEAVSRGDLTVTVTATGTLEPINQVEIGSELSGTIRAVNVDVNDEVQADQILAVMDTTRLKAQVQQAESALASARAQVAQNLANVKESKANLARLHMLYKKGVNSAVSEQDIETAETGVARSEANLQSAYAAVRQAEASLEASKTDLDRAEIRSPINGIVLSRSIEPGQTVAASYQAPVLFTLAENLTQMELQVEVDEADVGKIDVGQQAIFTVAAYPAKNFSAEITKVHFAATVSTGTSTVSSGVVTYQTILKVDNSDLLLRPGMTATAEIIIANRTDALLVPNAALRFEPPNSAAEQTATSKSSLMNAFMPRPPRRAISNNRHNNNINAGKNQVWILQKGKPVPVAIKPGLSDGLMTEILESTLTEETRVITGTQATSS